VLHESWERPKEYSWDRWAIRGGAPPQALFYGLSSLGLVVASALLTVHHVRMGATLVCPHSRLALRYRDEVFALAGYMLLTLAVIGWIVDVVRWRRPHPA